MLFNSYEFIFLFLPLVFIGYFYLNSIKKLTASKLFLITASLFFYSWWNINYLPLMLGSILINYIISSKLSNKEFTLLLKKQLFIFGLILNIGFLAYFKYMDFFIDNINSIFRTDIEFLHLALPLAISFFTLQQVAFLVDSYQGIAKKSKFLDYILFVTFFPQLIAGPIVHHKSIIPQFESKRNKFMDYKNIYVGLFIFSLGLFKKVFIADTFAIWANNGFDVLPHLTMIQSWMTSLSYSLELYFDFSGYTDMAIGIALLFNIKIPINFNSPFKSKNVIEFWTKWHITLSNFINAYVYTPILRSFKKFTFINALITSFITMLIIGLWHGASWMFVFYGALHGAGIVINHLWKRHGFKLHKIIAIFLTFNFINITFIFFRAHDMSDAFKVLGGMFNFSQLGNLNDIFLLYPHSEKLDQYIFIVMFFISFIAIFIFRNSMELSKNLKPTIYNTSLIVLFFVVSILHLNRVSEFIYFNF